MTVFLSAFLYFCRDLLKTGCLILLGRSVFGFAVKRRTLPFALFPILLAGVAVLAVAPLPLAEEDRRMLADAASFGLCLLFALSAVQGVRHTVLRFVCALLLLDFTVDALYSLLAELANDALWFEAAFGAVLFALLFVLLRYAAKNKETGFLQGEFASIPKWTWAVLLFFEFTCFYRVFGEALSWYRVFAGVSVVAVIAALFYLILKVSRFSEQQTILLQQLALQKDYGERLQRSDEELRSFRHDYKNHRIVMQAYLESGDIQAAKAYFESISGASAEALRGITTGNFAADVLINFKRTAAVQKGIRFSFEGVIPSAGVRDEDICTILSNLLDNAVESCLLVPPERDKNVLIEGICNKGWFVLSVSNPTITGAVSAGTLPGSTKADKKNHGYGLRNVKRTVQKYNGSFTCDVANGVFCATARLMRQNVVTRE